MVKLNTNTSIVDYLKSQKQDSSFANRTTLAKKYGINNYTGTAAQNMALLGKVKTPAPKTAAPIAKPPVTTAKPPTTTAKPTTPVNPIVPPKSAPTANTGASGGNTIGNVGTPNVTQPNPAPTQPVTPVAPPTQPVAPPTYGQTLQDQVNAMYDAQQQQRLQEFYAARDKGIADIKAQQAALDPQFAQARNQADVVSAQNMMKLQEQMANAGLRGSGENVTASLRNQTARQQALSGLDLEQSKQTGELEKGITALNDPNQELSIKNDISTQRQQALMDAMQKAKEQENVDRDYNRNVLTSDRDYKSQQDELTYQHGRDTAQDKKDAATLQYQKDRDKISDAQWQKEFDQNKLESDREFKQHQDEFNKNYGLDLKKFLYDQKVTEREWTQLSPAKQKEMALNYKYDLGLKKASGGGGGGGGGSSSSSKKTTTTAAPKYTSNVKDTTKTKGYKEASSTYDMKMIKAMYGDQAYAQFLTTGKLPKK